MPYVALYRQWRPQTFAEVVGQAHVTATLQNSLKAGRTGHAYLFAGPRGTGKTSVAKILARAVNCLEGPSVEPCNRCVACTSILDGSATDVIEIDAASNRGIDEIRDLRSKVKFCPASLRYKVYIIDEVHMLTVEAFNALLKTLEEPPAHAIFILATTEPHRIPATVLSRCQRFSFHRIPAKEVLERLEAMTQSIGLAVTRDALRAMARAADGSLRDALSLLDQCASFSEGEVSASHVRAILGNAGPEGSREIIGAVARGDARGVLEGLDRLASEGKDLRQFGRELTAGYRDMLVLKVCRNPEDLVDQDSESIAALKDLASGCSEGEILEAIKVLGEVDAQMRYTGQPRICLEVGLLKLTGGRRPVEKPVAAHVETQAAQPAVEPANVEKQATDRAERASAVEKSCSAGDGGAPAAQPGAEHAGEIDESRIPAVWQSVVARLKKEKKATIAAFLEPARPVGFRDGRLIITFGPESRFHMSQVELPHNMRVLETALKAVAGQEIRLACVLQETSPSARTDNRDEGEAPSRVESAAGPSAGSRAENDAGDDGENRLTSSQSVDDDCGGDEDPVQKTLELFDGTIV